MHILLNIFRSKGNQTMTFGQLIGYNIGEKKSYIKHVGETTPNPFLKTQN